MKPNRTTAMLIGAFFLISNIVFILGAVLFVEPVLSAPDYLTQVIENRAQVVAGSLLELSNGVAYIGIAVLAYPILRRRFPSMALWYVVFRAIEFVMQVLTDLSPMVLVSLGEEFAGAAASDAAAYQAAGAAVLAGRYWAFQMISITLVLGALLFYTMLYRTRLIPRFISIWGLVGVLVVFVNALMEMFGYPPGNLGFIMLLNEVFMGLWLMIRGFNPNAVVAESAA
jgi:hypothetical protein